MQNFSEIVLASHNAGKIREIQALLPNVNIFPQNHFQISDIEETGQTFVENAILKARNAALKSGLPALADDSGLVVDYLHGEPGIFSARYAGENATDQDNIAKLLTSLNNVPTEKRRAKFVCVLVFLRYTNDPTPIIAQGLWEGLILENAIGEGGFGYDPIFWIESECCSAAQLSAQRKNELSHRGKALKNLQKFL